MLMSTLNPSSQITYNITVFSVSYCKHILLFYGFFASSQGNLLSENATIELLATGRKALQSSLLISVFVSNMIFLMPQKIKLLIILYIYNDFLKIFLRFLGESKILWSQGLCLVNLCSVHCIVFRSLCYVAL